MDFLTSHVHTYDMLRYSDHHIFTSYDLGEIKKHYEKISSANNLIFTTEKDAVRLQKFEMDLGNYPIYVLPVQHSFLFGEAEKFTNQVRRFITSFEKGLADVPQ